MLVEHRLSAAMRAGAKLVGDSTRVSGKGYITRSGNDFTFDPIATAHVGLNGPRAAGYLIGLMDSATPEFVAETITAAVHREFPELFDKVHENMYFVKQMRNNPRTGNEPHDPDVFRLITFLYDVEKFSVDGVMNLLRRAGL